MKLNEFICPSCGRRTWDSGAYTRCDGCGLTFYLSQSAPPANPAVWPGTVVYPGTANR